MFLWRTLVQWLFGTRRRCAITTTQSTTQWPLQEPENKQEIEVEIITMPPIKLEVPAFKITHAPSERLH